MAELTRRQLRRDKWLLLTCVAVLTAMRILCHPEPAVCLVAPPHESLLDHDVAWNVPVTTLPDAASLYQVPPEYALCALSIAASFCLLCLPRTSTSGLLLLGLTAALPPQDVIIGWTIVAAAMGTSVSTRLALRAVILLIGICFSLETGFLVAACLLVDLADGQTHRRAALCCTILTGTVVCAGWAMLPGFGRAMCRPLTVWAWQQSDLLPHLASTFQQHQWLLVAGLTVAVFPGLRAQPQPGSFRTAAMSVLFLFGLLCGHYAGPALATITALALRSPAHPSPGMATGKRQCLPPIFVTVLFGVALILHDGISPRWKTDEPPLTFHDMQGRLLLGDLSESSVWKASAPNLLLVTDDRWDVNAAHYESLDGHLQDLYLGRQEIYKRGDGTWGGYRSFLEEINPALFVIPSRRTSAVRRVVMDPDWNVCGIDEGNVCFAHSDYGSVFRAQRLLKQVRNLEWPNARSTIQLEGLIKYETTPNAVARSLVAMRFPNAALRLLDQSSEVDPDTVGACWLEIANRSLRQTGRLPVIELTAVHQWRTRVSKATAREMQDVVVDWTRRAPDDAPDGPPASVIRQLISRGDYALAKQKLDDVDDAEQRSFLRILLSANVGDSTDLAAALEKEAAQWTSPELQAEALCGAGTLYLANGRPDRALAAFLASREALNHCYIEVYRELNIRNLFGTP